MSERARPLKRFGQHFLVRASAVQRIVDALAPAPEEPLLEIGPGRGALTAALLRRVPRVAAIELDRRMVETLRRSFPGDGLTVIQGDVLRVDLDDVAAALGFPADARWNVAGNLPYNVSKPVAMRLVDERRRIRRAALMFQLEVAEKLTAEPGTRAYGPLSVLAGLAYRIRLLFRLPPTAFRPAPKVDSAVTLWEPRAPDPIEDPDAERRLRRCLRISFARRRKTLRNNLLSAMTPDEADRMLAAAGIDGRSRPETLTSDDYLRLAGCGPSLW